MSEKKLYVCVFCINVIIIMFCRILLPASQRVSKVSVRFSSRVKCVSTPSVNLFIKSGLNFKKNGYDSTKILSV